MKIETDPVAPLMSEQLLFRDTVTGIPVHVVEVVNNLILVTLTANQKGIDILLEALETLVVRNVHSFVSSLSS